VVTKNSPGSWPKKCAAKSPLTRWCASAPSFEIIETAKTPPADVIVISTHGRTGLKHVLLGSVAERVVRHAPCPVLVAGNRA
jgi:nucleotide-binding universal stress UspA family protein